MPFERPLLIGVRYGILLLAIGVTSTYLVTPVVAQNAKRTPRPKIGSPAHAQQMVQWSKESIAQSTAWMNQEWKGNNRPFRAITLSIERAAAKKQLAAVLPLYKKQARANPWNARAQYRYVLADFTLAMQKWPVNWNVAQQWQTDIGGVDSPQTADYSRLQFLVESVYRKRQKVRPLGARLQKIYPRDQWISHFMTIYKRNSPYPEEISEIIAEDRQKVTANPNSVRAQANLTESTLRLWLRTRKRSNASAAVAAYKRYLQLLPADAPNRAGVVDWINSIPKSQAYFEAKGIATPRPILKE